MAIKETIKATINKVKTIPEVADALRAKDSIQEHLKNYVISPSQGAPLDLRLDIVGDEILEMNCDVTDHYVENNISRQDHISLKPKTYTINGEVGELVWYQKDAVSQKVGQVAQRLEGIISFLPMRSRSFHQMKKKVMQAAQWVDTASNIYSRFLRGNVTEDIADTKQSAAYIWLSYWRDERTMVDIKTPWGILQNYVITSCKLDQPKDTKDKTLISISFKEIRLASVNTVPFDPQKYQGDAAFENQPKQDNGKTSGEGAGISQEEEGIEIDWEDFGESGTVKNSDVFKAKLNMDDFPSFDESGTYDIIYHPATKRLVVFDIDGKAFTSDMNDIYGAAVESMSDHISKVAPPESYGSLPINPWSK